MALRVDDRYVSSRRAHCIAHPTITFIVITPYHHRISPPDDVGFADSEMPEIEGSRKQGKLIRWTPTDVQ